eukprot:4935407-Pyramimonas_sp.AAC.1
MPHLQVSIPLLAQSFHPTTRNLDCKTHAGAIAMFARRWLVHLCGRASPRMLARRAASQFGATDALWR